MWWVSVVFTSCVWRDALIFTYTLVRFVNFDSFSLPFNKQLKGETFGSLVISRCIQWDSMPFAWWPDACVSIWARAMLRVSTDFVWPLASGYHLHCISEVDQSFIVHTTGKTNRTQPSVYNIWQKAISDCDNFRSIWTVLFSWFSFIQLSCAQSSSSFRDPSSMHLWINRESSVSVDHLINRKTISAIDR